VSEDYAPFDIDVTTINPGSLADQVVAHIAIGGNWSDWYGASAGGVAYVGGFYNFAPNVGYVFEAALANGHARYVAEAASHEAGHLFGLSHQAEWNGPILVDPYFAGDANWAPIMGVGYNSVRTTWHDGPTPAGPSAFQNDLAILANASNGFGYRADDYGGSIATAAALPVSGTSVGVSGIVGSTSDLDVFSFDTSGGAINVQLSVSSVGPNLNSMLRLWDSDGTLLVAAAPSGSLGASISTTIGPGTFYLVAGSAGGYGNVGRYTISGTVPEALPPEVAVSVGGVDQPNGNTVDFGQTTPGSPLSQVFTVHNTGPGFLELTPLSADDLPDGFEIVANLGSTLLASGATTTFELRLTAVEAGMFGGDLEIGTSDSDENPFVLSLSGEVAGPEIGLRLGSVSIADGGTANFGATFVGTPLERTFTVQNTGTTTLTLAALNPASLPPGFTLVSNLGSTVLAAGESTTFIVRLNGTVTGSYSGQITLANDDGNESPFTINLAGGVTTPTRIIDNGAAGNLRVGAWTLSSNKGYQSDIHTALKGNGSRASSWTFSGMPVGQYRVWATWTGGSQNATNAPFQLFSGSSSAPIVRMNQRTASTGLAASGARWRFLGTVNINHGWVMVRLTNAANGTVVADAIRIVHVPAPAAAALAAAHTAFAAPGRAPGEGSFQFTLASSEEAHVAAQPAAGTIRLNVPPTAGNHAQALQSILASAQSSGVLHPPALEETLDLLCSPRPAEEDWLAALAEA
jgi:hypothetical protein